MFIWQNSLFPYYFMQFILLINIQLVHQTAQTRSEAELLSRAPVTQWNAMWSYRGTRNRCWHGQVQGHSSQPPDPPQPPSGVVSCSWPTEEWIGGSFRCLTNFTIIESPPDRHDSYECPRIHFHLYFQFQFKFNVRIHSCGVLAHEYNINKRTECKPSQFDSNFLKAFPWMGMSIVRTGNKSVPQIIFAHRPSLPPPNKSGWAFIVNTAKAIYSIYIYIIYIWYIYDIDIYIYRISLSRGSSQFRGVGTKAYRSKVNASEILFENAYQLIWDIYPTYCCDITTPVAIWLHALPVWFDAGYASMMRPYAWRLVCDSAHPSKPSIPATVAHGSTAWVPMVISMQTRHWSP